MSESAAKEYQIEEALTKMEDEWKDSRLEIVGYRETGTGILKGVDEINTVLDEQVGREEVIDHPTNVRTRTTVTTTTATTFSDMKIPEIRRVTAAAQETRTHTH